MAKVTITRGKTEPAVMEFEAAADQHPTYTRAKYETWKADSYRPESYPTYEDWLKGWHGVSLPGPMQVLTSVQLKGMAKEAAAFFVRERGYDEAEVGMVQLDEAGFSIQILVKDEFQENIPYDWMVYQGSQRFNFRDVNEFWEKVQALPGRESREIQVMLRQANSLGTAMKGMKSKAASAYAKDLIKAGEKYQNLISKQK